MGDGVLAYFGYPKAHEGEAGRAVRAGLALAEEITKLRFPGTTTSLKVRVGIATGLTVVGDLIGVGSAEEQSVAGETPNLAARLQGLAPPGGVVIANATRRLIGNEFELEDLDARTLKDYPEQVRAWRVICERRTDSRFEARTSGQTPLIGREQEIALLLDRWQQVREGEGQVVLLSGEPGIGKSRITRVFYDRIEGEPYIRLRHQCSPYHSNSTLHPTIEHLERAARFERDDTPTDKLQKLEALLAKATGNVMEATALVAALLSIPTEDRYPPLSLNPKAEGAHDRHSHRAGHRTRKKPTVTEFVRGHTLGRPYYFGVDGRTYRQNCRGARAVAIDVSAQLCATLEWSTTRYADLAELLGKTPKRGHG